MPHSLKLDRIESELGDASWLDPWRFSFSGAQAATGCVKLSEPKPDRKLMTVK